MEELFLTVLNMSLTASYVILFIILARLPLKKAPKAISYALWIVAAFRLVCPFSFESIFSLMPQNTSPIPLDIVYPSHSQIRSGIESIDMIVNKSLPAPVVEASVNPLQLWTQIGAYIWLAGIAVMLAYSVVSVMILKRRLGSAKQAQPNIYEADNLKTPFVLGFFRPKIYIPAGLKEEEQRYILLHEQTHIHRRDYIIKPFAFIVLSVHWFNPLVWLAFMLMNADMELSCDERVIREMGGDIKKPYAASLLSLATGKRILSGSPLAFGEGNLKGRIKNVLNFKKPAAWIIVVSVALVVVLSLGLAANRETTGIIDTSTLTPAEVPTAEPQRTALEPASPELSLEQTVGVDMAELDYASNDIVIFHDYFGLFVYDQNMLEIIRSLDLKPLNCHQTQGDNYCEVSVSPDGNTVQLHPLSSENMYVYTVSDNTLQETTYQPMEERFSSFASIEDVIDSSEIGNYSHIAVKFDTYGYGYLHTTDGTIGKLSYVRDDMLYRLFDINASEDTASDSAGAEIIDGVSVDLITSHSDIEITNEWISKDFGYTVLFGSLKDDPQQGVAWVIPTGDQEDKNEQKILTPEKHGAIKAESLGAKASILDVVAEDGYRWIFNVYNGFDPKN